MSVGGGGASVILTSTPPQSTWSCLVGPGMGGVNTGEAQVVNLRRLECRFSCPDEQPPGWRPCTGVGGFHWEPRPCPETA